jgi:hypothetical protein
MATRPKRPRDPNQLAKLIVDLTTGDASDKPAGGRAASGRAGGLKGGKTRMDALTREERVRLAKKAAAKRWGKAARSGKGAA